MPSTPNVEIALANPWIAHFLALVTSLTVLFALYIRLFVLSDGDTYRFDPLVGLPITLAIFWFIGWMAADVIGGRRTSSRAIWLVSMVLIPVFSTLVYYFVLWRPAKRSRAE